MINQSRAHPTTSTQSHPTRAPYVLLGLLAVFVLPFLLAWYLYRHPDSQWLTPSQHGQLITPPIAMNGLLTEARFERKWHLLLLSQSACDAQCEGLLNALHRLQHSLGEDSQRVDQWLISPSTFHWQDAPAHFHGFVQSAEKINLFLQGLTLERGALVHAQALNTIYLVDPKGRVLMVYPDNTAFKKIRKDLRRLLRASRIG